MDTPATVFDALLEESMRRQKSEPSTTARESALQARPLSLRREPRPWHLTRKVRTLAGIPLALRKAIRATVAGEAPWPLVVSGPAGCGKTCAALCLLDHAGGLYFTAASLAEKLILASKGELYNHDSHHTISNAALWEEIATTTLVVLDEVGAREKVSDWHYECVKRVLDEREGRPLMVLTNLSLGAIDELYDDRVASRLAGGTVLILDGPDRRLQP